MAVKFLVGTAEKYAQLKAAGSIKAENFYRISGTNDMYIGERKLTSEKDVEKALGYIGTLTELETTEKSNLVAALNEIKDSLDTAKTEAKVTIETTGEEGNYVKRYIIKQNSVEVGKIDIPKDLFVTEGSVVVNPAGQTAGKYIKLVIANQEAPIYINVADLVDVYTAQAGAAQVQIAINDSNVISATIVAGSISTTELAANAVSTAKIKDKNVTKAKLDDDVQTSLGKADTAVQRVVATDTAGTNGTITVDGTEVPVKGLGSAAYTNSSAYATAAQGKKADTAVQNVAEGTTNGAILVDSAIVKVHGLGDAAYKAASAFDAAGTATTKANQVLGTSSDDKDANTVYGAKAYAKAYTDTAIANAALVWETF